MKILNYKASKLLMEHLFPDYDTKHITWSKTEICHLNNKIDFQVHNSYCVYETRKNDIYIHYIFTDKNARGNGYAKQLVELVSKNVSCCAFVFKNNKSSRKVFESCGFKPVKSNVKNWMLYRK